MSAAWSWYIIVLVVINIGGCLWLLWWTSRRRPGEPETTGHVWDGDITEYNKPLPRWWINLFYLTIFFSIGYLIWYPGFGRFAGTSGWTSTGEHDTQRAANEARLAPLFARFSERPLPDLANDPDARRLGQSVFANHCATCHGSDARGAKGFPNLTDGDWQWGGEPEQILASILQGRQAVMPPLGAVLGGEQAVNATAVYVQSLSGQGVDPALAAAGKPRFEWICAACHGVDGKGMAALGAPNLTDGIWLYGRGYDAIREAIMQGRNGQMPAHQPIIGADRVRLAAAWVYHLDRQASSAAGAP
jgi:cytochrome c oxidase cbb3-type subunit 3